MAASNAVVAETLRKYAAALVLEKADRFKVKAYRRAAETIEALQGDVAAMVARGDDLTALPRIGKALAATIGEIVASGKLGRLERSLAKLSPEQVELSGNPRLDPKTVARIYKKLKIGGLAELKQRLESGEIAEIFGARVAYHVRQGLDARPRMLLWAADKLAGPVEQYLRGMPGVVRVSRTGSVRRKQDTVGDLNFLVAGASAAKVFEQFARFGAVRSFEKRGRAETVFELSSGVRVGLVWTPLKHWGTALVLGTGSEMHVEALEQRAKRRRTSLTPKGRMEGRGAAAEEADVYARLGLKYIEPELREGRGEVEAAAEGKLPKLVEMQDLRGDLHMHTTESDGANSLAEMAEAARARGYEYIAISDHSQSLKITNGLTEKRLLAQIRNIDKLNARLKGFTVLKSAEVDILEDGSLDYSDGVLKELDFAICSIHSRFGLDKAKQTERLLRATDNPYCTIVGHATGRLLLKREGYEIDIERVLEHARQAGCYFEINSSPDRLDLSDENAKLAKELGIRIAVNTDAHSTAELGFITAGINQARRAWLEPRDVLNTLPLARLRKELGRRR